MAPTLSRASEFAPISLYCCWVLAASLLVRLPEDFDNESIPSEWRQWLSYTRLNPPTADEMVHAEQSQEQMAINVARLEAEEAKQQFVQVWLSVAEAVHTAFPSAAPVTVGCWF